MGESDSELLKLFALGAATAAAAALTAAAARWYLRRHPGQARQAKRFARRIAAELTKADRATRRGATTIDDSEWFEVVKEVEAKVVNNE